MCIRDRNILDGDNESEADSTVIQGDITKNITWILAGSPYIISDTITVDEGVKLTIEPGVIVKFTDYSALIIKGQLLAEGNIENEITFTAWDDDFGPYYEDSWVGIMFDSCVSEQSLMKYCIIEKSVGWNGLSPVLIKDCSPTISHCTFRSYMPLWDSSGSYMLCMGDSKLLIEYNCIPQLISAYRGSGIHSINGANPIIFNNNIEYDGVNECWAVDGGGFLNGNYLFSGINNDTIVDLSLGIPVDEIGDGVFNTISTNEPPGFMNVDGITNPRSTPNLLDW